MNRSIAHKRRLGTTLYLHFSSCDRCIILRCNSILFCDCCAHLNLFDFAPKRFIFHRTDCNWFIGIRFRMHFGIHSVYKFCEHNVRWSALTITFAKSSCCRLFLLFVVFFLLLIQHENHFGYCFRRLLTLQCSENKPEICLYAVNDLVCAPQWETITERSKINTERKWKVVRL